MIAVTVFGYEGILAEMGRCAMRSIPHIFAGVHVLGWLFLLAGTDSSGKPGGDSGTSKDFLSTVGSWLVIGSVIFWAIFFGCALLTSLVMFILGGEHPIVDMVFPVVPFTAAVVGAVFYLLWTLRRTKRR